MYNCTNMTADKKHIVIDARIRRASTGRPVQRFLEYLPELDKINTYTILVEKTDDYTSPAQNINVKKIDIPRFSMNPLHQISFSWLLYRLKPNLVFFTMTGFAPLFFFGKNVTFTHDLTMLRFVRPGKYPSWLHKIRMLGYRLMFFKGNYFSRQIIVPTDYVSQDLASHHPSTKNKISRVYEAGDIASSLKSSPLKNITKPFIFHVGSPFPHKNIHNLVLAFEKLKSSQPELQLVLAGKKEQYFDELENWLKNRKHSSDIHIPGYITDQELVWLYQEAECYVLPSLSEGFGLPGLEAMSYNCPLVSSDATCLPEVYGPAAEYFDPLNVDDIAQKIDNVISSKLIQKNLAELGQVQFKKYSWQKMSSEIHKILKQYS